MFQPSVLQLLRFCWMIALSPRLKNDAFIINKLLRILDRDFTRHASINCILFKSDYTLLRIQARRLLIRTIYL